MDSLALLTYLTNHFVAQVGRPWTLHTGQHMDPDQLLHQADNNMPSIVFCIR